MIEGFGTTFRKWTLHNELTDHRFEYSLVRWKRSLIPRPSSTCRLTLLPLAKIIETCGYADTYVWICLVCTHDRHHTRHEATQSQFSVDAFTLHAFESIYIVHIQTMQFRNAIYCALHLYCTYSLYLRRNVPFVQVLTTSPYLKIKEYKYMFTFRMLPQSHQLFSMASSIFLCIRVNAIIFTPFRKCFPETGKTIWK